MEALQVLLPADPRLEVLLPADHRHAVSPSANSGVTVRVDTRGVMVSHRVVSTALLRAPILVRVNSDDARRMISGDVMRKIRGGARRKINGSATRKISSGARNNQLTVNGKKEISTHSKQIHRMTVQLLGRLKNQGRLIVLDVSAMGI